MTVLPPSGHKTEKLLFITTEKIEVTIKGPPQNKIVETFELHQNEELAEVRTDVKVYPNDAFVMVYSPYSKQQMINYPEEGIYPCFFEQTNYEVVIKKKDELLEDLYVDHINPRLREAITPVDHQGNILSGIVNFKDEVGYSRFEIKSGRDLLLSFEIEVYPSKMDYQRDFWLLLNEVNEEVYNLAFDFLMKTSFPAELKTSRKEPPTEAEFFQIMNTIFDWLMSSINHILQRPHHKIEQINEIVPSHKAKRSENKSATWLSKKPHLFEKATNGIEVCGETYVPRKTLDTKKELTYNTFENRFIKWMIWQLERKLKNFEEKFKIESTEQDFDSRVVDRVNKMRRKLKQSWHNSFLYHVGGLGSSNGTSLVLQMAPGYREAYKYYLMMIKGLHINSDIFSLSIKNMAQLYEYWCFLKINQLLRHKYHLERNDLVSVDKNGITVNLVKGKESCLVFRDSSNDEYFYLIYNRKFSNLPTLSQQPDNIVELKKKGANVNNLYVFDAKYRVSVDEDYISAFGQPGPPEDTINTMHRYRDAVVSKNYNQEELRKKVFGAYVLFPYNNENKFAGKEDKPPHKFFRSIEEVGIGAIPFLPRQTNLLENFLDELIWESSQSALERAVPQAGLEKHPPVEGPKNVLIGPLSRKEQLDICLQNNMYYTYLNYVQNYLGFIEYVAIYQSKRFFSEEDGQGIYYYGKVKDFKIVKRKELKEISWQGNDEQLIVQFFVDRFVTRGKGPIKAAGYGPRVPHLVSRDIFQEANIYPELHLKGIEIRLWKELRRFHECRSVEFSKKNIDTNDRVELIEFPGLKIEKEDGDSLYIRVNGSKYTVNLNELRKRPRPILREIIKMWTSR